MLLPGRPVGKTSATWKHNQIPREISYQILSLHLWDESISSLMEAVRMFPLSSAFSFFSHYKTTQGSLLGFHVTLNVWDPTGQKYIPWECAIAPGQNEMGLSFPSGPGRRKVLYLSLLQRDKACWVEGGPSVGMEERKYGFEIPHTHTCSVVTDVSHRRGRRADYRLPWHRGWLRRWSQCNPSKPAASVSSSKLWVRLGLRPAYTDGWRLWKWNARLCASVKQMALTGIFNNPNSKMCFP